MIELYIAKDWFWKHHHEESADRITAFLFWKSRSMVVESPTYWGISYLDRDGRTVLHVWYCEISTTRVPGNARRAVKRIEP